MSREHDQEVPSLKPCLVISYNGGLLTLNSATDEVLADIRRGGFLYLNPTDDGHHIIVSDDDTSRFFDTGLIAERHGNYYHYCVGSPRLTSAQVKTPKAGHAINHAGHTSLSSDSDDAVQTLIAGAFKDGELDPSEVKASKGGDARHGVVVSLPDGNMLTMKGTERGYHTIQEVDPGDKIVAETMDYPGARKEVAAQSNASGDVASLNCTNDPVVYRDGALHEIPAPKAYQRSGNQLGFSSSPCVLTDYMTIRPARSAEDVTEKSTLAGVIDTASGVVKKVDLRPPYWFRSPARGPNGEGLILTYNGDPTILDPASGEAKEKVKIAKGWCEKDDWREPDSNVTMIGDYTYISGPASKEIRLMQISTGETVTSFDLKTTSDETPTVSGKPNAGSKK